MCKKTLGYHNPTFTYLFNFLIFGFPLWGIFNYGFFSSFDFENTEWWLYYSVYIASIWIWLGPLLICVWEHQYAKFVRLLLKRPCFYRDKKVKEFERSIFIHKRRAHVFGLVICIVSLFFFLISMEEVERYMNIFDRPVILLLTISTLAFSGYASGYGFSGVWQAVFIFGVLKEFKFHWDPFHYDGRGGYSFLGDFASATWFAFSGGVVVVPASIAFASFETNSTIFVVYGALFSYALFNVLIFILPIIKLANDAALKKLTILEGVYLDIKNTLNIHISGSIIQSLSSCNNLDVLDGKLSIQNTISSASVIPVSYIKVVRVFALAFIQVSFLTFEIFGDNVKSFVITHWN